MQHIRLLQHRQLGADVQSRCIAQEGGIEIFAAVHFDEAEFAVRCAAKLAVVVAVAAQVIILTRSCHTFGFGLSFVV